MAIYHIDATLGSDSNTGLSDAQAWKTLAKASSLSAGDDVYLKCGETWSNERLIVNWAGVSDANRVTIGAYYVSGSEVYGVSGNRPIIQGNIDTSDYLGGYPGDQNAGLVHVSNAIGSYFTIENIETKNSNGRGVTTKGNHYVDIDNCYSNRSGLAGIQLHDCNHGSVTNCEVYNSGYTWFHRSTNGWLGGLPGCLHIVTCDDAQVNGNNVHECWGEGISFDQNTTNSVGYDNFVYASRNAGIYVMRSSNIVLKRNITIGGSHADYINTATSCKGGIWGLDEGWSSDPPAQYIYVSDNLIAHWSQGTGWSWKNGLGSQIVFNTIVDCDQSLKIYADSATATSCIIKNNIFQNYTGGLEMNDGRNPAGFDMDYNHWSADAGVCAGANDTSGDALLNKTTGWRSIATYAAAQAITTADFSMASVSSPCYQAGVSITGYSQDYFQLTRPSTPSIGAIEWQVDTPDPPTGLNGAAASTTSIDLWWDSTA